MVTHGGLRSLHRLCEGAGADGPVRRSANEIENLQSDWIGQGRQRACRSCGDVEVQGILVLSGAHGRV